MNRKGNLGIIMLLIIGLLALIWFVASSSGPRGDSCTAYVREGKDVTVYRQGGTIDYFDAVEDSCPAGYVCVGAKLTDSIRDISNSNTPSNPYHGVCKKGSG